MDWLSKTHLASAAIVLLGTIGGSVGGAAQTPPVFDIWLRKIHTDHAFSGHNDTVIYTTVYDNNLNYENLGCGTPADQQHCITGHFSGDNGYINTPSKLFTTDFHNVSGLFHIGFVDGITNHQYPTIDVSANGSNAVSLNIGAVDNTVNIDQKCHKYYLGESQHMWVWVTAERPGTDEKHLSPIC